LAITRISKASTNVGICLSLELKTVYESWQATINIILKNNPIKQRFIDGQLSIVSHTFF